MENKIIFDKEFEFAIKFIQKGEDAVALTFNCVECVACYDSLTSKPELSNYDLGRGVDDCTDFDLAFETNPLCSGYIKWDGCMELHNFNHHFCGYNTFVQRLIALVYTSDKQILGDKMDSELANLKSIS